MANNAKDDQRAQVRFGCTAKELKELMETRGTDAVNRVLHKYGTVDEICRRLHVVPNEGMPPIGFKTSQVVNVISREAASPPHTDDSVVFARLRKCAFPI